MSMRVYYDDTVVYNNVQHDGDNPTVEETNVDEPQRYVIIEEALLFWKRTCS